MSDRPTPRDSRTQADEIRVLDFASVLVRQWRLIGGATLLFLVVAVGAYLVWPRSYTARTVLLPAQDGTDLNAQLLRAQLPTGLLPIPGMPHSNQARVEAILKSWALADSLIARLGHEKHSAGDRKIRRILRKQTKIMRAEGGSLVITVRDRNPQLATRIAAEFPSIANRMVVSLGLETALHKQAFLEGQLALAHTQLEGSEQRLMQFQQAQDAPEAQEQARRTLEAAARLQQEIIEQEIKVAQLRRVATPDNPELQTAISELNAWRAQFNRLTAGQSVPGQVFFSLRESPELLLSTARLFREFKKDEQVYLSLAEALAEAQVSAKNDLPVVSVLDHPEVPREPSGFPIYVVAAIALLLGFTSGLVAAFGREYIENARLDPANAGFFAAWAQFRTDLARIVPRGRRRPPRLPARG